MGQQTFNNRGHDGLFHPSAICGLRYRFLLIMLFFQPFTLVAAEGQAQESPSPWWIWPLILLLVTFLMGIVAVLGGVGGGVLFVPIISGFFPFHLDFVR